MDSKLLPKNGAFHIRKRRFTKIKRRFTGCKTAFFEQHFLTLCQGASCGVPALSVHRAGTLCFQLAVPFNMLLALATLSGVGVGVS